MTTTDLTQLKRRLAAHKGRGGQGVPDDLCGEILAVLDRAKAAGTSYRKMAEQIGLSFHTLMGWRQRERGKRRSKRPELAPVQLASFESSGGAVVHGPRGLRIEGLSVAEMAELWVRLG